VSGFSLGVDKAPGRGVAAPAALERGRAALFDRREKRVRPGLDDKVLTGWNGLFLQTLAEAAAALGRDDWMAAARANARFLFADPGGFYTTGTDAEALITRPRDVFDNATPSANSLAANGLLRLAALTGGSRWQEAGETAVRAIGPAMGQHPTAFAELLGALE